MNMEQILETMRTLSSSQGMYGRVYNNLMNLKITDPDMYDDLTAQLEALNFSSPVDLVLYLES